MDITTSLINAVTDGNPDLETIKSIAGNKGELHSILKQFDENDEKAQLLAAKTYVLQHDLVQCYLFMRSENVTYESLKTTPSIGKIFVILQKKYTDDELKRYIMKALSKPEKVLKKYESTKEIEKLVAQLLNKDDRK